MHVPRIIYSHEQLGSVPAVIALSENELGRELHHLFRVLRLRAGEPIEILDLTSPNLVRAEVAAIDANELRLSLDSLVVRAPAPVIRIAFGLTALPALELVIEKLTELEVAEIGIFFASRSQNLEIIENKLERLERIRDSARIQSGSRVHTRMVCFESLDLMLKNRDFSGARMRLLASLRPEADNLFEYLKKSSTLERLPAPADVFLIVGPEGGLHDEEEVQLGGEGFRAVSLGQSTLRAETAAIAAASLLRLAIA